MCSITHVRVERSSEVAVTDPASRKSTTCPDGEPSGLVIEFENGLKPYRMGDAGLPDDMRLIDEYDRPDLNMAPICGTFVMGRSALGQTAVPALPIGPGDRLAS